MLRVPEKEGNTSKILERFRSRSRRPTTFNVSSQERQSSSDSDISIVAEESSDSTYSCSPYKLSKDSRSASSSSDSVTILPSTFSPLRSRSKIRSSKSKYPNYSPDKMKKGRSRSTKHERSRDKPRHRSHKKKSRERRKKKSEKQKRPRGSISTLSSDSESSSIYYKTPRLYSMGYNQEHRRVNQDLSNSHESGSGLSNGKIDGNNLDSRNMEFQVRDEIVTDLNYGSISSFPKRAPVLVSQYRFLGAVVRYKPIEAFGFIRSSQITEDVFFNVSNFRGIKEKFCELVGTNVTFVLVDVDKKSLEARNIAIANELDNDRESRGIVTEWDHTGSGIIKFNTNSHAEQVILKDRELKCESNLIKIGSNVRFLLVLNCDGGTWRLEAHDVYMQNENVFQVKESPKWKYQDRYEEDIEIDTNYELRKHSSGKFQEHDFEWSIERNKFQSNKNLSGNFHGRYYEKDWNCKRCGYLNFSFRIRCYRCMPEECERNSYNSRDCHFREESEASGGEVKISEKRNEKDDHWGKSVSKIDYIKNYINGKYCCKICNVTVANQHQIQIHMDGNSHKKKCGEVDSFYCELCRIAVTCQATLDSHRQGKNHLKRVKQEEDRKKIQVDEHRYIIGETGVSEAKEKQELDRLKVEIRTLQRKVESLEKFNQLCKINHSSKEYQDLLKHKTWCMNKHVRSKIQLKTSLNELKYEDFSIGDIKNQERKEGDGIDDFTGKIYVSRSSDTDNDYSPPIYTKAVKNN